MGGPLGSLFTAAALALALLSAPAGAAPPGRVVSINVCTDQLAMLIAGEGQLASVSHFAADPGSSALSEMARAYHLNHGRAEEIFLLEPDLVLAGTYTARTTVAMLRRLGFRVEEFAPETSLADVRANILRMGALLGQEERAETLAAAFDKGLAEIAQAEAAGKSMATYSANGYSVGAGSLADAIISAAGLQNVGARLGISGAGRLPLEMMILAQPDLIALDARPAAPARADEILAHPALASASGRRIEVPASRWICGGPFNLDAVRILIQAAEAQP